MKTRNYNSSIESFVTPCLKLLRLITLPTKKRMLSIYGARKALIKKAQLVLSAIKVPYSRKYLNVSNDDN